MMRKLRRMEHNGRAIGTSATSSTRRVGSVRLLRRRPVLDDLTIPCAPGGSPSSSPSSRPTIAPDERPTVRVLGDERVTRLRDAVGAENWAGSLVLAESVLLDDPGHSEAHRIMQLSRERIFGELRTADFLRVPRVSVPPDRLRSLALDHRSGFVVSLVDGFSTLDDVVDASGLSRAVVVPLLRTLLNAGVLELD